MLADLLEDDVEDVAFFLEEVALLFLLDHKELAPILENLVGDEVCDISIVEEGHIFLLLLLDDILEVDLLLSSLFLGLREIDLLGGVESNEMALEDGVLDSLDDSGLAFVLVLV